MIQWLWLIPTFPLAGFFVLATSGKTMRRKVVSVLAVAPTTISAVIAFVVATHLYFAEPVGHAGDTLLGTWFDVANMKVWYGFYLDGLSAVMIVVITFVASMILLYSAGYMWEDEGYSRYFACMNLFVAAMLILVLADNLLLLFLGWEGVGLCSYLLIGFWYREPENCRAAIKAFIVTRAGDALFMIGLLMLFVRYDTLRIQPIMQKVSELPMGSGFATLAALFLLGGAIGKSAQMPLQVWLPDAMAGPTPVSALIHAATMVTAGVYLIARTHVLFSMAPAALYVVEVIGGVTLLAAGIAGLAQEDIKRVLAYSTISQIGYMFLALGAGAWAAAISHFVTHAFFKSALFLGAGVLIKTLDGEHNIFKMGGLMKYYPITSRAFLMGTLTLAAIPPLTLTFNSKDLILNTVWASSAVSKAWWIVGFAGAFVTSAYAFRLFFLVFLGQSRLKPVNRPPYVMLVPMAVLGILAAFAGTPEVLNTVFGVRSLYAFLQTALPQAPVNPSLPSHPILMQIYDAGLSLVAMAVVYLACIPGRRATDRMAATYIGSRLVHYVRAGFGFDWLYRQIFVRPYVAIAGLNRSDVFDRASDATALAFRYAYDVLSWSVNGRLRWYVASIAIGAIILLAIVIF